MNAFWLMMSVALLAGVSAFPRISTLEERPEPTLYLIRQSQLIPVMLYEPPVGDYPDVQEQEVVQEEEESAIPNEHFNEESIGDESSEDPTPVVRSRRSTQPGGNAPQGGGDQRGGGGDRGGVEVGVSRSEGGGRRVEARGEGNVWQSRDGRGRVDVHGHYSRDYGGRYGTGRPQYGGGIRYSHRF